MHLAANGCTPTFEKLLTRLKLKDVGNFTIAPDLNLDLTPFDVISIDSKDSANITVDDFIQLNKKYPGKSWIILSQSTKDGSFTGSERWRNEIDTMIFCDQGVATTGIDKNRWGGKGEIKIY